MKDKILLFALELFPLGISKKLKPDYERPLKGNFVASIIRLLVFIITVQYFLVRPYMVPTGSMKNTILGNDFLLVNRFIYGLRTPDNISIPFASSYFVREIPFVRFTPSLRDIRSNDIFVFRADHEEPPVEYVKRCIGAPGDTVKMIEETIFVNNKQFINSKDARLGFTASDYRLPDEKSLWYSRANNASTMIKGPGAFVALGLIDAYDFPDNKTAEEIVDDIINYSLKFTIVIKKDFENEFFKNFVLDRFREVLRYKQIEKKNSDYSYEEILLDVTKSYFSSRNFAHIIDISNFSDIVVPKTGDVINFNTIHPDLISNVVFYDGHILDYKDSTYYIDGVAKTSYTVEQDYYFMIGDNRYNSLDSRSWGFVPHKYISGAPILIYFNFQEGLWDANKKISSIFKILGNIHFERIGQLIL